MEIAFRGWSLVWRTNCPWPLVPKGPGLHHFFFACRHFLESRLRDTGFLFVPFLMADTGSMSIQASLKIASGAVRTCRST